jgi:heme-degrading monooxygenase HmoA
MAQKDPFLALVIYSTTADTQVQKADNIVKLAEERLRGVSGLIRARVFLSEDGESLVTLTEWSDRDSFQKFREGDFGRAAAAVMVGAHPKAFWLRQHAAVGTP